MTSIKSTQSIGISKLVAIHQKKFPAQIMEQITERVKYDCAISRPETELKNDSRKNKGQNCDCIRLIPRISTKATTIKDISVPSPQKTPKMTPISTPQKTQNATHSYGLDKGSFFWYFLKKTQFSSSKIQTQFSKLERPRRDTWRTNEEEGFTRCLVFWNQKNNRFWIGLLCRNCLGR